MYIFVFNLSQVEEVSQCIINNDQIVPQTNNGMCLGPDNIIIIWSHTPIMEALGLWDSTLLQGETGRNLCMLTLKAPKSMKTGSNQKMLENKPQLFFNSALKTC